MILTIVLAICGGVGFCIACAAGGCCESVDVDGKPGGDDVEAPARGAADDLPPPPKHWSSEERQQLSLAVSSLPPSGLRDVRRIVGGNESTCEVAAPAGPLGVSISRSATLGEVRASGPLAGRVAVGDRLVSISTPGRALFTCGPTATGPDIVDELRAGAGSDGRVLTFTRRVSPFAVCCEPSRIDPVSRLSMAMGCPCFIVAVILFIMNEIFYHSPGGAVLSIFLFMLSAAGCVAGCCLSAICPATPPGEDDVEAPAAAAPRV